MNTICIEVHRHARKKNYNFHFSRLVVSKVNLMRIQGIHTRVFYCTGSLVFDFLSFPLLSFTSGRTLFTVLLSQTLKMQRKMYKLSLFMCNFHKNVYNVLTITTKTLTLNPNSILSDLLGAKYYTQYPFAEYSENSVLRSTISTTHCLFVYFVKRL